MSDTTMVHVIMFAFAVLLLGGLVIAEWRERIRRSKLTYIDWTTNKEPPTTG